MKYLLRAQELRAELSGLAGKAADKREGNEAHGLSINVKLTSRCDGIHQQSQLAPAGVLRVRDTCSCPPIG